MNQNKGIGAYQNRPGYFMGGMIGGAILGALVNKIQGKDWKRGALFGGITGGITGGLTGSGGLTGWLGSPGGAKWLAGTAKAPPGLFKTMLSQGLPLMQKYPLISGAIGAGGAMVMGDPAYDQRKMEEAMDAKEEEERKKKLAFYSKWFTNPWTGESMFNEGGIVNARPVYYNGGPVGAPIGGTWSDVPMEEGGPTQDPIPLQLPMGQEGSFESEMDDLIGLELSGLSDSERSELQSLMSLRLITPKDDPKYLQIEMRIQELMNQLGQETAMSMPHPDDEWQQMMDNFLLDNPGMEFEDLDDFKQWYMDNADFSPMDYAADGGLMKRPKYMGGGMSDIHPGTEDEGYTYDIDNRKYHFDEPLPEDPEERMRLLKLLQLARAKQSEGRLLRDTVDTMDREMSMLGDIPNPMMYRAQGGRVGMYGGGMSDMDLTNGGASFGPGTGTSDDIPAMLSDGEFVVTANAVKNLGGGNRMLGAKRMYQMMNQLDPNSQTPAEMDTTGIA
jgi:hypothetical protein